MSNQVYKVQFDAENTRLVAWVTPESKVLETCLSYFNGLQSTYIADPIVNLPDGWIDSHSSQQDLYWLTEEDVAEWGKGATVAVERVEYHYSFDAGNPVATPNQIGDRICVDPATLA